MNEADIGCGRIRPDLHCEAANPRFAWPEGIKVFAAFRI